MRYTEQEVIDFIEENNVKFIRLAFCDVFGRQKNISIQPSQIARAFESGIPFDAATVGGYGGGVHDLFLFPDPSTLALLPWRPSQGRVIRFFCDVRNPDGTPFATDPRCVLRRATERAREAGVSCEVGAECEFYLFRTDENGRATGVPFDNAGYMDIAPADRGENVRREICLTLEEMGISPESSHHEYGPGQNEIDFRYADARSIGDDIATFRMVVETIAARNGAFATFAPTPIAGDSAVGGRFIAGILKYIREMTLFLNPTDQSYERLGSIKAPKYVTWAYDDRSHLIRIPPDDGRGRRIEVRSPDSGANPYLATALLIRAGLRGVEEELDPGAPAGDLGALDEAALAALTRLPATLAEAREEAARSEFVRECLGDATVAAYLRGIPAAAAPTAAGE